MLTIEEIRASKINPSIAKEAYLQSEKKMQDLLEIKKTFEQKAFFLFNAYTAMALALFGVAGTLYNTGAIPGHVWPFAVTGLLFVAGAALFVFALLDANYGSLGSSPSMWLTRGIIDGGDRALPLMLAYLTFHHKNRITESIRSNDSKAKLIRYGIFIGLASPVFLLAALLCG
jgi:hypothetical protein